MLNSASILISVSQMKYPEGFTVGSVYLGFIKDSSKIDLFLRSDFNSACKVASQYVFFFFEHFRRCTEAPGKLSHFIDNSYVGDPSACMSKMPSICVWLINKFKDIQK